MSEHLDERPRFGGRRAIVVGGSMAGLIAARVLSDHFDEVTLVERDELTDGGDPRKGVPQGRHLHVLLKRGEEILTALFPGILDTLVQGGAVRCDFGRDAGWYHFGAWKRRFESGIMVTYATRPFIEAEVRRRTFARPNVRRLDGREVTGFVVREGGARVYGVRVRPRGDASGEEALEGDLVVDASGRGSRTPAWLEALGFPKPEESTVEIHIGYATRLYRRPEPSPSWKTLYILGSAPASKRFGALAAVEGGRWIATLGGFLRDYPPSDPEGYLAFARSLPVDDLYRVLESSEPLGDISVHRFPSNLRRRYERMRRMPEGIVVIGDALCSFNPIYGQGMTTACLNGLSLDRSLREHRSLQGSDIKGFSTRFHREIAKVIDVPWSMTTGEDFRYPEVEGARPFGYPLMTRYLRQVHRAATRDDEVNLQFLRVVQMLAPPSVLLHPRMIARVLRASAESMVGGGE